MIAHRPAALTLAFVLLTGPMFLLAEEVEVSDTEACIQALRLTPELAETGTYATRVQACVKQREHQRFGIDRSARNAMRYQQVQDRLTRNSRAINYRVIGVPETPAERGMRWKQIYGYPEQEGTEGTFTRPSRRMIQAEAMSITKQWRNEAGDLYQTRLKTSMDACKHLDNDFHRNNCIRAKMVELGKQK